MPGYADVEDPVALLNRPPDTSDGPRVEDAIQEAGFEVQAVNWVWQLVVGEDLVTSIIEPITGDFEKISQQAGEWRNVKDALQAIRDNLNSGLQELRPAWQGQAADGFHNLIGNTWTLGIEADAQAANLVGLALQKVADGSRAACDQALNLIKMLVDKLIEAAALLPIPVVGWGRAVKLVYDGIQIYNAITALVEGVQAIVEGAQQTIEGVQQAGTALSQIKDVQNLNDALNTANEVGQGVATTAGGVNSVRDGLTETGGATVDLAQAGASARDVATGPDQPGATTPANTGAPSSGDQASATDPAGAPSAGAAREQANTGTPTTGNGTSPTSNGAPADAGGRSPRSNPSGRTSAPNPGTNGQTGPASTATPATGAPSPGTPSQAGTTTPADTGAPTAPNPGQASATTPTDTANPGTAAPGQTSTPTGPDGAPAGDNGSGTADQGSARDQAGNIRENNDEPRENARPTAERPACADPIDVATGHMMLTQTDVDLPGMLPLVVTRTHVSSYRSGRWFGPTWASTVDQRLEVDDRGVCFAGDDGVLLEYPVPGESAGALPLDGPRWPLGRTPDGGYTVTRPERGQTLHFLPSRGPVLPIAAVSDRNGHRIDFDYDVFGTITGIRDDSGRRIAVETGGGVITALRLASAGPDVDLMRYGYEGGNLTEVTNASGAPLRFDYDRSGRVTRWVDRNGQWYSYGFDGSGRCVRAEGADGVLDYTFDYDRDDLVTVATNSLGHTTSYQLNEALQIVRETNPLGHTSAFEWDRYDRLLSRTDPLGRTTRFTYDDLGNLTSVTHPDSSQARAEYNELGLAVTSVDADGAVWRREYDDRGNPLAVVDPLGSTTTYRCDERGHLTAVVDPLGHVTRVETDAAGLPVRVTDPLGAVTSYTRDAFGWVVAVTDPVGGVTRFGRTVEGRLAWRTLPDGATERWHRDGEGNIVEHVDALGQVTRSEIVHFDLPGTETGPDGARLRFSYDTELRLTAVTNAAGLTWRYDYDPAGNLVRETDFNGHPRHYAHDAAGQLVRRVNGAGQTVHYTRDLRGNVVEQRYGEAVTTYWRDAVGRITHAANADAEVVFERDPLGRVVAETCNGRTVASSYDAAGSRVRRRTPSGAESTWVYDANGRPAGLRTAGQTIRFHYDAAGREVERQLGAGAELRQTWDANHQLSVQAITAAAGPAARQPALLQRRSYRYRPDGQLTTIVDQLAGLRTFDLDPVGRPTRVEGNGWTEQYAYDAIGNITHAAGPTGSPARGEREHTGTLLTRAGAVHYRYDGAGRVVLRQRKRLSAKAENWHYTWDADDRMVGVTTPDGQRWRYRYDPLGRRIAKQRMAADGATVLAQVDFVWDGTVLAEQRHRATADRRPAVTVWDWQPGGFRPVSQTHRGPVRDAPREWVDEQFYAIVTDLVGTPTEMLDAGGNLAWRAHTTLWGEGLAGPSGTAHTPLRFPGQYHDEETGLNYNYHRYYDPEASRYQAGDPLGLEGGLNPHAYVVNPLSWLDPLGLTPCRGAAFNEAKQDLGIPRTQHPDAVNQVPMTDRNGRTVMGENGPIMTREYVFTRSDGGTVIIQDHSAGRQFNEGGVGDQGPHFNVRPPENTRTGHVPGTREHYPFE